MTAHADSTPTARMESWDRLKDLFAAALDLPAAERAAFVAEACGEDAALRVELAELLRAAEIDDGFIEQPAADTLGWITERTAPEWIGRRVGPYHIVELAGRGGLSQVYRAVLEGAGYERQVALKLLRPGFGDPALLRRFRAERSMLAGLAHPNVAHFIDGGATEDGTPYLVMEYVEGRPIDEYCDAKALALESRIDLFRVLCGAVHYVHQHLMVHGDLKGSNVLVTPEGVVKLLDFGIARLLVPEAGAGEPARLATLMLLTPDYASPEQLRGEPLTTASDVYSLGALLYRLLTGATPYGTGLANPVAIVERMTAGGPLPPAVAAERSGGTPATFARSLRGDLGNVLLKALKVDPRERYASAQQLAEDLHRWLRGFPVEARPDSTGYRLRKWAQRHRASAVLSALAIAALIGGIAATSWQAHLAQRERERAERHFDALRELSSVFLADVYQAIAKTPGSVEARKLLVENTLKYLQALERDASDSPQLRRDLGIGYERLGDVQGAHIDPSLADRAGAIASYRHALEIRRKLAQEYPSLMHRADLLRGQVNLIEVLLSTGDVAGAQEFAAEMVELAEQVDADPAAGRAERRHVGAAFMNLGWMEWSQGHVEQAVATLGRAREVHRRIAAANPDDPEALRNLALVTARIGEAYRNGAADFESALRHYREALDALESLVRAEPLDAELARMRAYTVATIGDLYNLLQRPRDALAELEAVLPEFRRMRADDPADQIAPFALAALLSMIGDSRLQLGDFEAARAAFAEAESLIGPAVAATVPDLQLVLGTAHAGLAQANAGIAAGAVGAARGEALEQADRSGRRALAILEPLANAPQIGKDAQWQIGATRNALGLE